VTVRVTDSTELHVSPTPFLWNAVNIREKLVPIKIREPSALGG